MREGKSNERRKEQMREGKSKSEKEKERWA